MAEPRHEGDGARFRSLSGYSPWKVKPIKLPSALYSEITCPNIFSEPSALNKCAKEGFSASGKGPGIQQTPSPQPLHVRLPPRPRASLGWVVAQQCGGHFCKVLGRNYSEVGFFLCERLQLLFDVVFDIWVLTIGVSNPHDLL